MKSILSTAVALTLLLPSSVLAAGGFTCQKGPNQTGNALSYCVYDPVNDAPLSGWPTIISLPGSGARGSDTKTLAGYDAVGKLVAQYLSGNKDSAHVMAATKFLTIVPIAPDGSRHFNPDNVLNILNEVKANYNVDANRVYVTGFSMGSRGAFRFATAHPEVVAALAPSAGGSEKQGDGTLSQEPASAVFPLLKSIVNIPLRQFAGSSDSTAGTDSPKATQQELERLGAKDASLEIMNTDHMGLSTKPWTDTDLLSWFLKQSKSGASSSTETETETSSASSSPSKSTNYTPVEAVPKSTGMVKVTRPSATPEVDDTDEEDCEDDTFEPTVGGISESGDEEDCEEEEDDTTSTGSTGSTTAISEEEDCDEEYTTSTSSNVEYGTSYDSTTNASSPPKDASPANEKILAPSAKARRGWTAPAHSRQHHRSVARKISHKRRAVRFGKEVQYTRK